MRAILGPSFHYTTSVGVNPRKKGRTARLLVVAALLALLSKALLPPESPQLRCDGRMASKYGPGPATVFVDLKRPGWALREWGRARGSFRLEIPQAAIVSYQILRDDGDLLELVLPDEEQAAGTFAISTGELKLHTPQGLFRGGCEARSG